MAVFGESEIKADCEKARGVQNKKASTRPKANLRIAIILSAKRRVFLSLPHLTPQAGEKSSGRKIDPPLYTVNNPFWL